ncbi:uncharacterized protein LOC114268839 [Camellia sinensis]|uniref:uncharacterized protein LOC114268839 n=1 Tax=Camellia sinensis TaxID=4442 RepID=UPI00103617BA|nr:uncharacterized protein LOC114268839 [Camellia sinensis]
MEDANARNVDETEPSDARMTRLERMVEALTGLVRQQLEQNQQPQQRQPFPPPPPPPVQVEPINYDDIITMTQKYKKLKLPEFVGGIEPLQAEAWEEARRWWMLIRDMNRDLTWDRFKGMFYEKYFPQCMRDRKVSEFEQLKQGTMSVAEYEAKFTELARYAPHMVDTDYKKARKFEGGLHVEVLDRSITTPEPESKKFKKQKMEAVSESVASVNDNLNSSFNDNTTRGNSGSVGKPICRECGKQHGGICRRGTGVCYKCGQQ